MELIFHIVEPISCLSTCQEKLYRKLLFYPSPPPSPPFAGERGRGLNLNLTFKIGVHFLLERPTKRSGYLFAPVISMDSRKSNFIIKSAP